MIAMVAIVLRTTKELGGISTVMCPISMACTMEQLIVEATESNGMNGMVTV